MPFGLKTRVLLVSSRYKVNSGLLVSSTLDIRSLPDFDLVDTNAADRPGIAGHYKDTERRSWRELNLRESILDEKFLQIAI